jgi:hypothetical protein
MKKINRRILGIVVAMLVSLTIIAQVSHDSLTTLTQQKNAAELENQINARKLKLAKLENSLEQKRLEMQAATEKAQQSANSNSDAAARLSSNAQDKKLARKAKKAAKLAKIDSRHARTASDALTNLRNEIASLKNKISADETKLSAMK